MEIRLDFKVSKIRDILSSLLIIENKEVFDKEMLGVQPYSPDKNVEKYLQKLIKSKKIDKDKLSFYFHHFYFDEEGFSISDCLGTNNLSDVSFSNVEEYIVNLRNRNEEEILKRIVYFLADGKEKDNFQKLDKYEDVCKDKNKTLDLLKSCNISGEAKWNIYMIINEPEQYMNEFCDFIEAFLPVFDNAFEILNTLKEKFDKYISDRIDKEGIEYLRKLPGFESVDKFEHIIVSTMTINYASVIYDDIDNTLHVYIGMNIEKVLEIIKGKSDEEVLLSLLKTISDGSRFNMLKALQDEELFGMELAEKLGLSNATISHHINFLQIADLIMFNKRNGKTYYKLNKEPLRNMVNFIIKEFNL